MRKIVFNWIAVILWLGVIYYFSSQPDLKSELAPFWDFIFRKIAHMAEYFVLAYLFFRTWQSYGLATKKSLFLSFSLALVYAIFDEFHQSFVAGRTASPKDVLIDSLGIIGFVVLRLFEKK